MKSETSNTLKDITIRYATPQEIDAICEFEKEARLTEPDIWLNEFSVEEYKEKLIKAEPNKLENNAIVIAEENGKIVGRCDIIISLNTVDFEKTGYIDWVYVLKEERGRGIGKELFYGAEMYFRKKGVKSYYLFTAENEQAQEFYHRQEFQFSRREVAEKEL